MSVQGVQSHNQPPRRGPWRILWKVLLWALLLPVHAMRRKGIVFLVILMLCSNLDRQYPWIGGNLSVVGTVLLPPLFVFLWLWVRMAWGAGVRDFLGGGAAIALSGSHGLLKAWVEVGGSELPVWAVQWLAGLFGFPTVLGTGAVMYVTGLEEVAPVRLLHPDGIAAHIHRLDPLLTVASIATLGMGLTVIEYGRRRWLASKKRLPAHLRSLLDNSVVPVRRARRLLLTPKARLRRTAALASGSKRNLLSDEIAVAADMPVLVGTVWQRARYILAQMLAKTGVKLELTALDPTPLVTTKLSTSALVFGGSETFKTQGIWKTHMLLRDGPVISLDPQGNAQQDAALRRALGRRTFIFDASLGAQSASCDTLMSLPPEAPWFGDTLRAMCRTILPEVPGSGSNDDLRSQSRLAMTVVAAAERQDAEDNGSHAAWGDIYERLLSPQLAEYMRWAAEHGHPRFKLEAASLADDMMASPELVRSIGFFLRDSCNWMGDPAKSALISGQTALVADIGDVLADAGRSDWLLQPTGNELQECPALFRLILQHAIRAHTSRTSSECLGKTPTHILIDELEALLPMPEIPAVIEKHRQKGLIGIFIMQSGIQVEQKMGEGTQERWEKNAGVLIFARPDNPREADHIVGLAGKTAVLATSWNNAPGGDAPASEIQHHETTDVLTATELLAMRGGEAIVIARRTGQSRLLMRVNLPVWYHHVFLQRRFLRAQADHGHASQQNLVTQTPDTVRLIEVKEKNTAQEGEGNCP